MDDRQIIALFYDRDEKAISEIAQKYGGYCFSVANTILQNEQDSEECVSDTWLRAWNAIPPGKPSCLRLFLGKITRNLAFNRWKAMHSQKRGGGTLTVALDEISEFLPDPARVDTPAEEEEFLRSVNRFLRSLPERDRNIFLCRYYFAESAKAIAEKCALTEGNVRKILSRTRNKLKAYLERELQVKFDAEGHLV